MKSSIIAVTLAAIFATGGALAHRSSDGTQFVTTYNSNGAVLKSKDVVIYLGVRCDASSPTLGKGTWTWSNGGFEINLQSKSYGFPRQEIDIEDQSKCIEGIHDSDSETVAQAPARVSPATIHAVYAICMGDQADTGHSSGDAKTLCQCVVAHLKKGEQSVATDFMSMAGFYKKMQFVCSVEAGPESVLEQFGR